MATTQLSNRISINGLATNSNFLNVKPGTLSLSQNVTLNKEGMVEGRRGFDYLTSHTSQPNTFFEYQGRVFVREDNGTLSYGDGITSAMTAIAGTWNPPSGATMHGVDGGSNLFITRDSGLFRMAGLSATPRLAGMPCGLDMQISLTGTGTGYLAPGYKVGYAVCWTNTDASLRTVRGAPSTQHIVTNSTVTISSLTLAVSTATATTATAHGLTTGDSVLIQGATQTAYNGTYTVTVTGSTTFTYTVSGSPATPATTTSSITCGRALDASVTFTVPQTIQAGDRWELYRSIAVTSSGSVSADMYLVQSGTYTSGTTVTVTDTTLESLAVTPLYTNSTMEGATAQNYFIPVVKEIESFKDYLFIGNVKGRPILFVNLITATGSLVDNTSAITIQDGTNSCTYTFSNTEDTATRKFLRSTSGTASQNIATTAQSLVRVINRDAGGFWWAQYVSGQTDLPGNIVLFSRAAAQNDFWLTANAAGTGSAFSPVLPTSGSTVVSTTDNNPHRLYWSKAQQPEHFAIAASALATTSNYIDVGRKDKAILRIVGLRDSVFVIKEDGVFYIQGNNPNASALRVLDNTTLCIAPRSIVRLSNEIYMLSNQGFVRLSESAGSAVISYEIENTIKPTQKFTNIASVCHACGFEDDRIYICWVPTKSTDTTAETAFVYNVFRKQWSTWKKPTVASGVFNGNLYVASGWENSVLKQRNDNLSTDYSDEEIAVEITEKDATTLTLTYGFAYEALAEGFTVHQGTNVLRITAVESLGGASYRCTLSGNPASYSLGAATVRIPIDIHIRHHPDPCGNAAITKTFLDFGFDLEANTVSKVTLEVASNENGVFSTIDVSRVPIGGWGVAPWGAGAWGGVDTAKAVPIRENVPVGHITGEWLTTGIWHKVSQERFSVVFSYISFQMSTDVSGAN